MPFFFTFFQQETLLPKLYETVKKYVTSKSFEIFFNSAINDSKNLFKISTLFYMAT